ncbi:hypothetical protein KDA_59980 [Dictyobacter alpinus]|uniref:Glycoside hydrolase family 42 N-terminal domain-containing protein n=1 Tax=Dictyobacter alpinus TaxID=2014873 RepID=A0A402BGI0_9CHLR|nr:beta-galactosidase [Dictyobacter alpinus]GCE30514.1 hypothetical protein KDA_59980 [Dictyobacter alpinus]
MKQTSAQFQEPSENMPITLPGSALGIVWSYTYGYEDVKAEIFMPQLRQIGAGMTRILFSWNQLEPEEKRFDWQSLDTFLQQLQAPEEALLTLNSASLWATRQATTLLPPSPAKDLQTYYRFVHTVVSHCRGRIRYWQNDNEPSSPLFWAGTVEEFIAQTEVFYRAVKDADPDAIVVLGGCDGLFDPDQPDADPWSKAGLDFFKRVLAEAADYFDVFDLHSYMDPYMLPAQIRYLRQQMRSYGYEKPIIIAEYNGPGFTSFPVNLQYMHMMGDWITGATSQDTGGQTQKMQEIQRTMHGLYAQIATLAPQTQMFLQDCSPALEQKRARINCRELVIRSILALSAGAQKTLYWNLWADTGERYEFMNLMFGKHKLMDYEDGELKKYYPAAQTFQRMAAALADVQQIQRLYIPEKPTIYLFTVQRPQRSPLFILWEKRDTFTGEDAPATSFTWTNQATPITATDILGETIALETFQGHTILPIKDTPVIIECQ